MWVMDLQDIIHLLQNQEQRQLIKEQKYVHILTTQRTFVEGYMD